MDKATYTKMIARRVSKGFSKVESMMTLAEIIKNHAGDNLATALVYNEFATEKQAYKFINSLAVENNNEDEQMRRAMMANRDQV